MQPLVHRGPACPEVLTLVVRVLSSGSGGPVVVGYTLGVMWAVRGGIGVPCDTDVVPPTTIVVGGRM